MPAKRKYTISTNELAAAYGCSRQNCADMLRRYGEEIVANPDALFAEMLRRQTSQIRFKLTDPDFRSQVKCSLMGAAFRQAVKPPATRKA